jgi:hypothetical protein
MTRLLLCTATILALSVCANAVELPDEMVNEIWRQCLVNEHGDTVPDDVEDRTVYAPNNAQECLEPISKSFEKDNEAGELDKAEEIVGVVFPANKDAALPLNPGEEALDEPAAHVAA